MKLQTSQLVNIFERWVLPIVFITQAIQNLLEINFSHPKELITYTDDILKPLIFAYLLFMSSTNKRVINLKVIIGILLSYASLYFLSTANSKHHFIIDYFYYFSLLYYLCFSIFSLLTLGRSFAILPAPNPIIKHGPYKVLKHPIYSSYIHFFLIFFLFNFNVQNLLLVIAFMIGIFLRATEEEKALGHNYLTEMKAKQRFFNFQITTPVVIAAICIFYENFIYSPSKLSVNISYPVYSMKPHVADDWSSFFIMNHVYRRLTNKKGFFRNSDFIKIVSINCHPHNQSPLDPECKRIQINYSLSPSVSSCSNQEYKEENFRYELEEIAKTKNWLFPNFSWCKNQNSCFEFDNTGNIQNRLDSIYLRFGWSISSEKDGVYGIQPTCFHTKQKNNNLIIAGNLITPGHDVLVSTVSDDADIFLYEHSKKSPAHRSIRYYNPIYYYLVLNGKNLKEGSWISIKMLENIKSIFQNNNIITQGNISINVEHREFKSTYKKHNKSKSLIIPDYLKNCEQMQKQLQRLSDLERWDITFSCSNVTEFVENNVKKGMKSWDGFISPLTPGLPGKDALEIQYFTHSSTDSWLGKEDPTNSTIHLLGVSHGSLSVSSKLCSVKPNALGLSDINIDDLHHCE